MKDTRLIRALRDLIMSFLNWWSDNVVQYGCSTDERWLLAIAWAVEARATDLWIALYEGSNEELEDALDGRPLHHMTERQQAHYIGVMAAGGES